MRFIDRFTGFGAEDDTDPNHIFLRFSELQFGDAIGDPGTFRGIKGSPVTLIGIFPDGNEDFAHICVKNEAGEVNIYFRNINQKIRLLKRY